MQSIWEFIWGQHPHPDPLPQRNPKRIHLNLTGETICQIHGTAIGTRMVVSSASIFMSAVETGPDRNINQLKQHKTTPVENIRR